MPDKRCAELSVAIICCNEEENIGPCLESVKWADEIVVVDSGSTDSTPQICRDYGVQFHTEPWRGFSAQKNSAVSKATKPWVLSLDADERVTPALRFEIENVIGSGDAKDGYFIARRNFFLGKWIRHSGWYPDYNLRLFKRGRGTFRKREVHEAIELEGVSGHLKNPMEHYTYKSIGDYIARLDRYSTLAARQLQIEKKRARLDHIIFHPGYTFFNMYVMRAGFLDGYYGLILSIYYSFYTFSKYAKLKELNRN
ncbi:MAG: glycosyltransferase family 2 protein [Smithellaceae bacterium]|nr:glycosyltransferase family 2 protein [Smithellaceae bacterium]